VLSNEYRKSEYCLNEAGIIWFKSEESEKSVIVLSLSSELIQAGFIDNDYIQLRLMDPNFLGKLSDRLKEMLSKHGLRQSQADFTCFNKLVIELEDYKKGLPFIENLIIPYTSEGSKDIELSKISDAWNRVQQFSYRNPNELKVYPYIFYKEYIRQIRLSASDIPGKIRVKTITKSVIVNLSSKDYADEYSSLFLKKDGGYTTFTEFFRINGEIIKNIVEQNDDIIIDNPYKLHKGPNVIIPAHHSYLIEYITQYDIAPELFFQSKVLSIPCGKYVISADFESSFIDQFGDSYIFRSQFIPPTPNNLRDKSVPRTEMVETENKQRVHYDSRIGFPAGGGYAITISKVRNKPDSKD
jgi:hypothetical protein